MPTHLSGRSNRDWRGPCTNLYLAALADAGKGKDESRGAHALRQLAVYCVVRIFHEPHLTMLATGIPKVF